MPQNDPGLGIAFTAAVFLVVLFATLFPEQKNPSCSDVGEMKDEPDQK
jgi:hypothetical protein